MICMNKFLRVLLRMQGFHICGNKWGKVFNNGPSRNCGRQSLKNLK